MKKLLMIVCLMAGTRYANAQFGNEKNPNPQPIHAVTTLISETPFNAERFHKLVFDAAPGYHLVFFDTIRHDEWQFGYKNGNQLLNITYYFHPEGFDPDLGKQGVYVIDKAVLKAQFLETVKIYNALFSEKVTAEQIKENKLIATTYIDNGNSFLSYRPDGNFKPGYWVMEFLKK